MHECNTHSKNLKNGTSNGTFVALVECDMKNFTVNAYAICRETSENLPEKMK